jgi:hypothetical protein
MKHLELEAMYSVAVSRAVALASCPPTPPPHAVGDHREERDAVVGHRHARRVGEGRLQDVQPSVHRRDQEMVLIVLPDLALVRQAVDVDLLVARLAIGAHDACASVRGTGVLPRNARGRGCAMARRGIGFR